MLIGALVRTPGTLLRKELIGDAPGADWTLEEHLLAAIVDQLAAANWQRGGGKGSRPEPISPLAKKAKPERIGNVEPANQDEIRAVLAANAGR